MLFWTHVERRCTRTEQWGSSVDLEKMRPQHTQVLPLNSANILSNEKVKNNYGKVKEFGKMDPQRLHGHIGT